MWRETSKNNTFGKYVSDLETIYGKHLGEKKVVIEDDKQSLDGR
jgi:hypothetical protein